MISDIKLLKVVIASPSDLIEERNAVEGAIHEWNAEHSVAEKIVLLPVRWESHAMPESGGRPQEIINRQLIDDSDILIGLFWTKLGTATGVAASGTVEEVERFIENHKPCMLYFSNRPIDPSKIDIKQLKKLADFKRETYASALVGRFSSVEELSRFILRDILRQVRDVKEKHKSSEVNLIEARRNKLTEAKHITEIIKSHRELNISPKDFKEYKQVLGIDDSNVENVSDPLEPGQTGPNGYPVGYNEDGDKVEWIVEEGDPEPFEMILRRGDKAILEEHNSLWDKVWWNRHQVLLYEIEKGIADVDGEILATAKLKAKEIEDKYGRSELLFDEFDYGLLNGKLSALSWVLGSEWEESLDT